MINFAVLAGTLITDEPGTNKSEKALRYLIKNEWEVTIAKDRSKKENFLVMAYRFIEEPEKEDWGYSQYVTASNYSLEKALEEAVVKAGNDKEEFDPEIINEQEF